jgi:DNA modification methylase
MKWHIETRKVCELIPDEHNPRVLTKKGLKDLRTSVEKFGLAEPIVINTDNMIIGGHGRAKVLPNDAEVEVYVPERQLTKEEYKELNVRLNKNIAGEWDFDILANEFEIEDLLGYGFDEKDLKIDMGIEEDEPPGVPAESTSQLGDIFKLGDHRLLCGDSTKLEDVEKLMGGGLADMVFTDPPYNVDYGDGDRKIKNDKFKTNNGFYQFLFDSIGALRSFVKGDVYICMSSSELHTLQKAFIDCGGHWSTFIIWVKNTFTMGRANYQRQYEPILYGWFEGSSHYWSGIRKLGDVYKEEIREEVDGSKWIKLEAGVETDIWDYDKPSRNKEHPTMKPIKLCARAIKNSSRVGDIVLDTFGGSGSTLMACEQTNRKCYTMELDPRYVDVIIKRWIQFTGEKAIKL